MRFICWPLSKKDILVKAEAMAKKQQGISTSISQLVVNLVTEFVERNEAIIDSNAVYIAASFPEITKLSTRESSAILAPAIMDIIAMTGNIVWEKSLPERSNSKTRSNVTYKPYRGACDCLSHHYYTSLFFPLSRMVFC
jgi:hypothetical protein